MIDQLPPLLQRKRCCQKSQKIRFRLSNNLILIIRKGDLKLLYDSKSFGILKFKLGATHKLTLKEIELKK